jgi:6-phosphogluconolactonase
MSITESRFDRADELILALANFIENELKQAVADRGSASLVVSGGNTPRPLLETLSQRSLPWDKITITLADERWVELSSDASNEAMIRKTLLQGPAAEATFIPLKNSAETAAEGQEMCQETFVNMTEPFDLVILGMGDDGHTASLFPGVSGSALDDSSVALCESIIPPEAPHERMTLTARALLNSRKLILHIVGDSKWQVYQNALSAGTADQMPIRIALHQDRVPVDVYWSP